MSKKLITCPACGSDQVSRFEEKNFADLTLGGTFSYQGINYKCKLCEEEGDFLAETDKNYLVSQKKAQCEWMRQTLEDMSNMGITMAAFERVFELPVRTLTRWKNGDFSSTALALFRILITYPWIIEVAENKFEKKFSKCAVVMAAAQEFKDNTVMAQTQTPELSSASSALFVIKVNQINQASVELGG